MTSNRFGAQTPRTFSTRPTQLYKYNTGFRFTRINDHVERFDTVVFSARGMEFRKIWVNHVVKMSAQICVIITIVM